MTWCELNNWLISFCVLPCAHLSPLCYFFDGRYLMFCKFVSYTSSLHIFWCSLWESVVFLIVQVRGDMAGLLALSLYAVAPLVRLLTQSITTFVRLEVQMVSVERVRDYLLVRPAICTETGCFPEGTSKLRVFASAPSASPLLHAHSPLLLHRKPTLLLLLIACRCRQRTPTMT